MIIAVSHEKKHKNSPFFIREQGRAKLDRLKEFPEFYSDILFQLLPPNYKLISFLYYPLRVIEKLQLFSEFEKRNIDYLESETGVSFVINNAVDLSFFVLCEEAFLDEHLIVRMVDKPLYLLDVPKIKHWLGFFEDKDSWYGNNFDKFYAVCFFFTDHRQIEILTNNINLDTILTAAKYSARLRGFQVELKNVQGLQKHGSG